VVASNVGRDAAYDIQVETSWGVSVNIKGPIPMTASGEARADKRGIDKVANQWPKPISATFIDSGGTRWAQMDGELPTLAAPSGENDETGESVLDPRAVTLQSHTSESRGNVPAEVYESGSPWRMTGSMSITSIRFLADCMRHNTMTPRSGNSVE
jgi:hypothetical protein